MRRVRVRVGGLVQGVGFRYAAAGEARRAGVSGWVRNRRDGTVEAEIEGDDDAVTRMLAWLHSGPPGARVDDVVTEEQAPLGSAGFDVAATV